MKIGIIGGAGYTAGELLRILLRHPQVEIAYVHSNSNAHKPIYEVHQDLIGETELHFTDEISQAVDVVFLCVGHGEAVKFLEKHTLGSHIKIIDLSQDHRLGKLDWVYGLPELNKPAIQQARFIANPGCFATCIELALLPLAKEHLLNDEIHISGTTGSTGAGQKPTETTHFSWRNNNLSVYKAFEHQHLAEITQSIRQLQPNFNHDINFIPYRGNFTRGILASVYLHFDATIEQARAIYQSYYENEPFVVLSSANPDLKQVINTNKCILYLEKHKNKLLIISLIDNLTKGASGQAVQNMNLLFGLEETTGLLLKPSAF
ncbi:N-acetyl-gamma-glutamyl-phosphate reductase [Thermoflexibacter ruber]|uniref:N-acetyl-gamma-glutamyl-phosphate reductase n=1 Tax=Thermoflexibacter ruber TaxID=1003 RepID=A0A1I2EH65_9BACT|nr:N-acetyl-gamma-glutamyl-phosphate reductase [Thermoflexibacter ruber]SFE92195.1 N-acetyl-gamma-glutamyl-phosphate reductase [Thermoflexibacter ruber]